MWWPGLEYSSCASHLLYQVLLLPNRNLKKVHSLCNLYVWCHILYLIIQRTVTMIWILVQLLLIMSYMTSKYLTSYITSDLWYFLKGNISLDNTMQKLELSFLLPLQSIYLWLYKSSGFWSVCELFPVNSSVFPFKAVTGGLKWCY